MTGEVAAAARAPDGSITISRRELEEMVSDTAEDAAERAVRKVFREIGISVSDEARMDEARADLDQLCRWRRAWDRSVVVVGNAILITVAGGVLLALWIGIKVHVLRQP